MNKVYYKTKIIIVTNAYSKKYKYIIINILNNCLVHLYVYKLLKYAIN